jgi:ABC-type multidrug transport system permease subunit
VTTKTRPPLVELTIARLKEFVREPEALFWVFGFPLLLTVALGLAFRERPPEKIVVGIVAGPDAQNHLQALSKSEALRPRILPAEEGREALRRGEIALLVEASSPAVYRYDPTTPDARAARVEVDNALQAAAGRRDVFRAREEFVQEQGSRYIDFLVPGLLGMNLMSTGMWGMAFPIVNARMKKLLKRLVATPMRKSDYVLAQFLSRLVFLIVEVIVVVAFGWIVFDVRVHGSLALLAFICLLGGLSFAALGLLISSRARTLEAVSGLTNLAMMPMWLCSGVFFSYERFPDAAKPLIRALPLTALNDALRAVMNDGLRAVEILPELANLGVWAVVAYVAGMRIFRWQ